MPIWLSISIVAIAFYAMAAVVDGPFMDSLDVIAKRLKLPSSVAGATLLALGTSLPELSTAIVALFAEGAHPATGVGSVVGSAIFQILVVVGFAAWMKRATLDWRPVMRDSIFYALSIALLIVVVEDDRVTLVEACVLVGSYAVYLVTLWVWSRNIQEEEVVVPKQQAPAPDTGLRRVFRIVTWPVDRTLGLIPSPRDKAGWTLPVFFGSMALIAFACYWLVFAAEALAQSLSVPPAIIALTILAGGSSIPELISSAKVSRQGRGDMAIANAVGSNIFDILVSLGLPVLLYCLMYGDLVGLGGATITSSIILLFATLVAVVGLLAAQRFRVGRVFGSLLIVVYVAYVVFTYLGWFG